MNWIFDPSHGYAIVLSIIVNDIPAGAKLSVDCAGRGCRFRSHTVKLGTSSTCARQRKHCHPHSRPRTQTVDLTRLFHGWHLAIGTKLTISIAKRDFFGKAWIFKMRSKEQPATRITCLAPGSSMPGRGC